MATIDYSDIKSAMDKILHELKTDNGYYLSWHANISMAVQDSYDPTMCSRDLGQLVATTFLERLMGESVKKCAFCDTPCGNAHCSVNKENNPNDSR